VFGLNRSTHGLTHGSRKAPRSVGPRLVDLDTFLNISGMRVGGP
jgi:hypothetical protein